MTELPADEAIPAPLPMAIFEFSNLRCGAGTERWVENIAKRAPPSSARLTVIQTGWLPYAMMTADEYENLDRQVRILTVPIPQFIVTPPKGKVGSVAVTLHGVGIEFLGRVGGPIFRALYRRKLPDLTGIRLVYCIRNDILQFLPLEPGTVAVGSTHMVTLREPDWLPQKLGRFLLTTVFRRFDAFHYLTEQARQQSPLPSRRSFFVPYGVDCELYHPGEAPQGTPVRFLFVGRLEPIKGVGDLLKAWSGREFERCELQVVGDGSLEAQLSRASTERGNVTLHGSLPQSRLAEVYRSCDVFVLPSRRETFGAVVLEAISSGLFVITGESLRPTFDEFEAQGALTYVAPNGAALKRAMLAALGNIDAIRARRAYVHALVKKQFDWEVVASNFFAALDKVAREVRMERGVSDGDRVRGPSAR